MKVLWLYYHVPQFLLSELDNKEWVRGTGWVDSLLEKLLNVESVKLSVLFPYNGDGLKHGRKEKLEYFAYSKRDKSEIKKLYKKILQQVDPDIIHVWGSEALINRLMIEVCNELSMRERIVLNLQGFCFTINWHYRADIPARFFYGYTFRDLVKRDNLLLQQKKFGKRGENELWALQNVAHVIGRTDWDRANALSVNSDLRYYFSNEILRACFYDGRWSYQNCEKYTIFMSQATYPIKGLHYVLRALKGVKKQYPNVLLRIAGPDYVRMNGGLKSRIKDGGYARYLRKLILEGDLGDNVMFVGELDAEQMKAEYLRTNLFISASTVENESNSLSEAKILGVPVIVSYVGGVTNRIIHGYDGFAYQHDAVYMLEYYIKEIFVNSSMAERMGENAIKSAGKVNDVDKNVNTFVEIYKQIAREA